MMYVTVQFNGLKQFQRALASKGKQVEIAAQQAINRTLTRSRTQMTNAVGEKLNLRKKTIRDLVAIRKVGKVTGAVGKLMVKHKPTPLIAFNAKQNQKGVSFKLYQQGPRKLLKHAFTMKDRQGRETVFLREHEKVALKIKPRYGSSVANVSQDKLKKVYQFARAFLESEYRRLIKLKKK